MEGQAEARNGRNGRITWVECIGVEKRTSPNKHFVYVLQVSWSNSMKHPVYRTYSTFFELRSSLLEEFKGSRLVIQELPALTQFEKKGIFPFREATAEKRKKDIQDFCSRIMSMADEVICSDSVTSFFETWYSDYAQLPPTSTMSLTRSPVSSRKSVQNTTNHFSSILDNLKNKRISQPDRLSENTSKTNSNRYSSQDNINSPNMAERQVPSTNDKYKSLPPGGMPLREEDCSLPTQPHRATCTYKSRKPCEVDLQMGTQVHVLECNQSGWWLVQIIGTNQQGWAPGAFLEPVDDTSLSCRLMPVPEQEGVYFAICDYMAGNEDEISCRKGDEVQVLEKSLDGWWRVRNGSRVGLIPGMHLERKASEQHGKQATTASTVFHRKSIYRRGPPPRRPSDDRVSGLSIEIPVYSEIHYINRNSPEASQGMAAQLSVPTDGNAMPVYAQVNKLHKTPSLPIQGDAGFEINEDGLKYACLDFEENAVPRIPPKQEMTEYAVVSVLTKATDLDSKHTYDNLKPSPISPNYENFPTHDRHDIRTPSPLKSPLSAASTGGRQDGNRFDFNFSPVHKAAPVSFLPCRPDRAGIAAEQSTTEVQAKRRSGSHESVPLSSPPPNTASNAAQEFYPSDWLLGKMNRSECETILMQKGQQQDFFVRESTNRVGDFTLSVLYESRVRHFPIECTNEKKKYYIGKHHFKDLSKVVNYYRTHALFYDEGNKPVQLGRPVNLR